jgi:hypothetical protein
MMFDFWHNKCLILISGHFSGLNRIIVRLQRNQMILIKFVKFQTAEMSLKILTEIAFPEVNECFNFRTTRPSTNCYMPGFFPEVCFCLIFNVRFVAFYSYFFHL